MIELKKKIDQFIRTGNSAVSDVEEGEEKEEGWEEEFNDVASNAEIIDPDIVVTPPKTKDAAPRQIKRIKMVALKSAMTSDSAPIVNKLLNGKQLEELKSSELDSVFFLLMGKILLMISVMAAEI